MDLKGLKKKLKSLTKMQIYHIVCIGLCVISFVLSFIVFFPCVRRAFQGFVDIVLSIGHLFSKKVKVGVTKIPNNMDTVLPLTIEEFKAVCKQTGKNFINKNYVKAFLVDLVLFVFTLILIIAMLSFVVLVIVLCIKKMYKKVNINHNKDTKALLFWFKLQDKIYYPAKSFILNVWSFAKKKKAYIIVFLGIWSLNFNVLTIALEAVAFVLYFIKSFDMLNIFVQIAKLAVDINVLFRYMPIPIWMFIGYKIFHHIRKERGFEILEIEEMLTIEVLEDHPGDLLGTGKPRAGKTFLITYLQKLQAKMFRRTAKEKSFDRRMEFPFFPWILVEQTIIAMRNMDAKFCLGTLHAFIDDLEGLFVRRLDMDEETKRQELERLQGMGYQGHDFCFDYNYERYGLGYDNNAKIVYLFDCIHMYADHFYRYSAPTSNIFNNYPVRDYVKFIYFGNYPLLDEYKNELRVTTEELYEHSQYSHKDYFDMGRLGVLKEP